MVSTLFSRTAEETARSVPISRGFEIYVDSNTRVQRTQTVEEELSDDEDFFQSFGFYLDEEL